jgi:hypothetical protein
MGLAGDGRPHPGRRTTKRSRTGLGLSPFMSFFFLFYPCKLCFLSIKIANFFDLATGFFINKNCQNKVIMDFLFVKS